VNGFFGLGEHGFGRLLGFDRGLVQMKSNSTRYFIYFKLVSSKYFI
jgi:hypothetical protein